MSLLGGRLLALAAACAAPAFGARADPPRPRRGERRRALEAQKAAFLAMPEADRKAVQDALGWLGFYNGAVDGAFGKRTRDSIVAYQQSVNAAADGSSPAPQLAALKTAAQKARGGGRFRPGRRPALRRAHRRAAETPDKLATFERRRDLGEGDGSVSFALQVSRPGRRRRPRRALRATDRRGGRAQDHLQGDQGRGILRRRGRGQGREVLYALRQVAGRLAGRAGAARLHLCLSK